MTLTLLRPTPQQHSCSPVVFSDEWHRQEEAEERAWLDAYISDPLSATIN